MLYLNREICSTCEHFDVVNIRCKCECCNRITKNFLAVLNVFEEWYRMGYNAGRDKAYSDVLNVKKDLKNLIDKLE